MANYPAWYILSWFPRFLSPSLAGDRNGLSTGSGRMVEVGSARTVRLVFLGDLSGVVNRRTPTVSAELRRRIAAADLVVANCESPVVERPLAPLLTRMWLRHAMTPAFLADALEAAGVDTTRLVLSVANNHALDQGAEGFVETLAALRRIGATVAGLAGEPPPVVNVGGVDIAFDAFTIWRNAPRKPFDEHVAMAPRVADAPRSDLICVLPHWDREFRHVPADWTRAQAHRLVEDGARLVVGGHPHVPQPVEAVSGALIAYSLGDFLGTAWRVTRWPLRIAAMLEVDVVAEGATRGGIAAWSLVPIYRHPEGARERLSVAGEPAEALPARIVARMEAVFATPPPPSSP